MTKPWKRLSDKQRAEFEKFLRSFFSAVGSYLLLLTILIYFEIWILVVPIVSITLGLLFSVILAYNATEMTDTGVDVNTWFTYVRDGTIKTVVAGKKFVRFIPNIKGKWYNPQTCHLEVAHNGEDEVSWFTELTGLYFVSWIWPMRQIYTFPVFKVRMKPDSDLIEDIRKKIDIDAKATIVDFLLNIIDRPLLLLDVDLKDGSRVNLIGRGIYELWDPYRLLFGLSGRFFDNLDSLVAGYILSKNKLITFDEFRSQTTELNPMEIIGPDDENERMKNPFKAYDVKHIVGLICQSLVSEDWSLSEKAQKIQAAIELQEIRREEAKALRIQARGEKDQKTLIAIGEARAKKMVGAAEGVRYQAIGDAFRNMGMASEDISRVFEAEQIKELKGTLVQAGRKKGKVSMAMQIAGQNTPTPPPVAEAREESTALTLTPKALPPVIQNSPTPPAEPVQKWGKKKRKK